MVLLLKLCACGSIISPFMHLVDSMFIHAFISTLQPLNYIVLPSVLILLSLLLLLVLYMFLLLLVLLLLLLLMALSMFQS